MIEFFVNSQKLNSLQNVVVTVYNVHMRYTCIYSVKIFYLLLVTYIHVLVQCISNTCTVYL